LGVGLGVGVWVAEGIGVGVGVRVEVGVGVGVGVGEGVAVGVAVGVGVRVGVGVGDAVGVTVGVGVAVGIGVGVAGGVGVAVGAGDGVAVGVECGTSVGVACICAGVISGCVFDDEDPPPHPAISSIAASHVPLLMESAFAIERSRRRVLITCYPEVVTGGSRSIDTTRSLRRRASFCAAANCHAGPTAAEWHSGNPGLVAGTAGFGCTPGHAPTKKGGPGRDRLCVGLIVS
jgi:hypothetical protein